MYALLQALLEAHRFAEHGVLPEAMCLNPYIAPVTSSHAVSHLASSSPSLHSAVVPKKRSAPSKKVVPSNAPAAIVQSVSEVHLTAHERRRLTVKRYLGLAPPANAPAHLRRVVNPNVVRLLQGTLIQEIA